MYKVIGIRTKKVYVEGETRSECLRKLQKRFPKARGFGHLPRSVKQIYPETLIMAKEELINGRKNIS